MYNCSIVASGHTLVSEAAGEILQAGGNAFDAVVAAGFASVVVEPALTSLGGGGLLLAHSEEKGADILFDFFVDTPGLGRSDPQIGEFFAVTVNFSGSAQDFNVGAASVAVPGTLKGLMHVHRRLGRMPLGEVIAPAKEYALGHVLNRQQEHFFVLLEPILSLTPSGREIYMPQGCLLRPGDTVVNSGLAAFFTELAIEGEESFYRGEIARSIVREMEQRGGLLTADDLYAYTVYERKPLTTSYGRGVLHTAGDPSIGGPLIALSLGLQQRLWQNDIPRWGSEKFLGDSVALMREVEVLRSRGIADAAAVLAHLDEKKPEAGAESFTKFNRGTTHISIADRIGNCASMTCSNGEGSGIFAGNTGVMLNNMMGEDDLHPDGFHTAASGTRVRSMMSPTMYMEDGVVKLVIGSGGSKRIRSAIGQTLSQVVDFGISLDKAVSSPRFYLDGDVLQIEPGFSMEAINAAEKLVSVNQWPRQDVYFGGVHAVIPGEAGAGDARRGGSVRIVRH